MTNTRVIALMFHRIHDAVQGYYPQQFSRYLEYLIQNFPIVIPGEKLPDVPLAICLTFDDAYFDFYHDVYPLLLKHKIKALLAVPVKYILEKTTLAPSTRLSVAYPHDMESTINREKVPLCTWEEINEMAHSQHVIIASHGFSHANLAQKSVNFTEEIIFSQQLLEKKLSMPIKNFVYPFGRWTSKVHQQVCSHYEYGIRIGSALNLGWDDQRQFIYRINADPLWTTHRSIDTKLVKKLTYKYWINRLRRK